MKKFFKKDVVIAGVAGLIVGALAMGGIIFKAAPSMMILEDESAYGFEETTERFQEEVEAGGWSVVGYQDMQQVLEGHGYEVLDIKIYELCSSRYSALILAEDDERIVSPLMPCRVAIYKKSNGLTYVTRLNSLLMAKPFGGLINEVMQDAGNEVEEIIAKITK